MATGRTLSVPLDIIERCRHECPMERSPSRSLRNGDAVDCKTCDRKWELAQAPDTKAGEIVRSRYRS